MVQSCNMTAEIEKSYAQVFTAERTALAVKEIEQEEGVPFILKATKEKVGISGTHLHFRVPVSVGEERLIGNLSLTVDTANPLDRSIHVTIRTQEGYPVIFSLDDVFQKGDVLEFGSEAKIILRRFRQNGRPVLHMAVAQEIRVSSRERSSLP